MTNIRSAEGVVVTEGVILRGDITIGADSSIWYHATLRGDSAPITIGSATNIQDNCVVHVDEGCPTRIGDYVTIGHGAIIHGCTIGDRTLVGMGAIILNGAVIGTDCIIGAGALVTQNMVVPDGSLVLGAPAKIKRETTAEERRHNMENAMEYVREAKLQ